MKEYKLIDYNDSYYHKLQLFLKRINPQFSDEYIKFIADNAQCDNEEPAILVVDEYNNIVGTHLYYYTKAKVRDKVVPIRWGHDTFLEEEYRRYAGLDLVIATKERYSFGIGISDVNKKIIKKQKSLFYPIYSYLFPSIYIIGSLAKRFLKIKPSIRFKASQEITSNHYSFLLIKNIQDLHIPNDGYWNKGKTELDFVRDKDFLDKRFFSNPVLSYTFYKLKSSNDTDECYFVVRPIIYNRVKTLMVVDYRYNLEKEEQLTYIVEAAKKLAKTNKYGMTFILTSDQNMYKKYNDSFFVRKRPGDFVVAKRKLNLNLDDNIIATSADSDGDYHR